MSLFYKPVSINVNDIPIIIYPMKGVENLIKRDEKDSLLSYIKNLQNKEPLLQSGTFQIIILWVDSVSVMSDVWIYRSLESEDAGYTIDCKNFRDLNLESGEGITASDGLIMLGREAELEESLRKENGSVSEYVFGVRPVLPGELNPKEEFQVTKV